MDHKELMPIMKRTGGKEVLLICGIYGKRKWKVTKISDG